MTSHDSVFKLSLMPIRKHKRTSQRVNYYQTECLDCELILSVRWEREYIGILSKSSPIKTRLTTCPFCESSHLKISQITESEYKKINQQWSMMNNAERPRDDMDDWLSWLR
ncbi:hypothetical protein THII_3400 [Thioploca ingrica]|uniref:Uncharacterized protein n=1 Tax=Thioploca ingrica TaxID=40754 RepID=A0A090ANJ8_9GAMM|nr:hypothetical protein THII_3400 [Thioploca ingrica]